MAIRSDITRSANWFRFERKVFSFTILKEDGTDADSLEGADLIWILSKEQGSDKIYLTKTIIDGITISDNIVSIEIEPTDYENFDSGVHYHELWDVDNNILLSYGDAYIHKSIGHD